MPSKPPIDPVHRPEPAVGQVWRTTCGREYVVLGQPYAFVCVNSNGHIDEGFATPSQCVLPEDTYVGQFAGFKVQEEGGK